MRDKSFLFKFEEIATLYQYLYLEESHSIEITNILGVILRLRMDERGHILCQNTNFPDLPESDWSETMTISVACDRIEQLKDTPAVEFPNRFQNRWEEIEAVTRMNLCLNR